MAQEWFNGVVANWIEAMESRLGLSVDEIEAARQFIDGEYEKEEKPFEYPNDYLALRAFFSLCMHHREQAGEDEVWASPWWAILAATEKGYRMGYAHGLAAAQEQGKEKPNEDTTEA